MISYSDLSDEDKIKIALDCIALQLEIPNAISEFLEGVGLGSLLVQDEGYAELQSEEDFRGTPL